MRFAFMRAVLGLVAAGELAWSALFYLEPKTALGALGRIVLDPVISRQYPLYLASVALAYALAAVNPRQYRGVVWMCIAQRATELSVAAIDWRVHAIATSAFVWLAALEIGIAGVLLVALRESSRTAARRETADPADRGLIRMLRAFGGLEVFWFLASTIFVQLGSRLLGWKLQDPYTTQQQGIALLFIGYASLLVASDVSRYRVLVWVPVASQLIGIANAFKEIHLGSITWSIAAIQWTIESAIVGAFIYFSRHRLRRWKPAHALAKTTGDSW